MFHSYFNEYVFDDINIYLLTSSCVHGSLDLFAGLSGVHFIQDV